MAQHTNHYKVLRLALPSRVSSTPISPAELRKAYKQALLSAHPDKKHASGSTHTVDEVKQAYAVLADATRRAEYDEVLLYPGKQRDPASARLATHRRGDGADVVLGLELLDLADFAVTGGQDDADAACPGSTCEASWRARDEPGDEEVRMSWTRACRCGEEQGYRILEEQLEEAEGRGEREVLVGCVGCSLWVRVEFGVEGG